MLVPHARGRYGGDATRRDVRSCAGEIVAALDYVDDGGSINFRLERRYLTYYAEVVQLPLFLVENSLYRFE